MSELLLELYSEEIPAGMQNFARENLAKMLTGEFQKQNISYKNIQCYTTPRRIVAHIEDIPDFIEASSTERKGPKVGANENAITGFLKSTGLQSVEQLEIRDGYYFAIIQNERKSTDSILTSIVNYVITNFNWPKSMRWGAYDITWIRPLHNILCLFNEKVLDVTFGHLKANNESFTNRLVGTKFKVENFAAYKAELEKGYVILDSEKRKEMIATESQKLAANLKVSFNQDESLLEEVAGLLEYPTMLVGKIEEEFMHLPKEVLITSMKVHQRYFSCMNGDKLAPYFFFASANMNKEAAETIIAGNQKVLRARLSDAKFFYEQDQKEKMIDKVEKLSEITFHAKLGTVLDKVTRMSNLASELKFTDTEKTKRACMLSKVDLVTNMVGEFPELQGLMGSYYATLNGEDKQVANGIKDHYKPNGQNDAVPTENISMAVAILDKLDSIAGMFIAGEKPTSSKDPFAVRRAALGIIRIIIENNLSLDLASLIKSSLKSYGHESNATLLDEIFEFFTERFKFYLKNEYRHDIISAAFSATKDIDFADIKSKIDILTSFINSTESEDIISSYKRISNILDASKIEDIKVDASLLSESAEQELFNFVTKVQNEISSLVDNGAYKEAMEVLAKLKSPINSFFDNILVNTEDTKIKNNRLLLLNYTKSVMSKIADFSLIQN